MRPDGRPWVVLAIVLSAQFMLMVDISIVNVAIPSIRADLGASPAAIQLVVAGYQLAYACVLITAGRLGDTYSHRRMFLLGMAGFTAASVAAAVAPSAGDLVVARVLQGLCGGLMFPQVLSMIQLTFPPGRRGQALGALGAVVGVATVAGPLLSGVLIHADVLGQGWRSIFYVNLPVGCAALLAAWRLLPDSRADRAPRPDLAGAALATVGLALIVYPLAQGPARGFSTLDMVLLSAAAVVLAVFVAHQRRKTARADSPLVPSTLFADPAFGVGLAALFAFTLGLPAFFFTSTLFLQDGLGYSALDTGLVQFTFAVSTTGSSFASVRLARRLGKHVLTAGSLILAATMAAMLIAVHVAGTGLDPWLVMTPLLFVGGIGLGTFVAPATTIILSGVRSDVGAASGVLATVQNVGGAVGVAAVGVLFFTVAGRHGGSGAARFTLAFEWALVYECAVFLVSLLLVLVMPADRPGRPDVPDQHPQPVAAAG
jgi:EmrB/QacA subfamily drug resistance transporter